MGSKLAVDSRQLAVMCMVCILVLFGCSKQKESFIVKQYTFADTRVKTHINKTTYSLPEFIDIKLSIELNVSITPIISIDKYYKKQLHLEHFRKSKSVGTHPDKMIYHYKFQFSALKADSIQFPGFNVSLGDEKFYTDKMLIVVKGVINDNETVILKPIVQDISFASKAWIWWLIIPLIIGGYLLYRKQHSKTHITANKQIVKPHNLINMFNIEPSKRRSPQEFDKLIQNFFKDLKSNLAESHYEQLITEYKAYYTETSFSQDINESERQEKLMAFIFNHESIGI